VKYLATHNCKPKENVLFLKNFDNDFSNIESTFFHYGDKYNLPLVLPKNIDHSAHLQTFKNLIPHPRSKSVQYTESLFAIRNNTFTQHARYNHKQMQSNMPIDTIFVIVIKNPTSSIKFPPSYYKRKAIRRNKSTNYISFDKRRFKKFRGNQMSFNLGLDTKYFSDLEMIKKFIQTIDSQFHLVMIHERMEESLIHLQYILCWTLDDMIVFRHNVRNMHSMHNAPIALKQKTHSSNNADALLYKYFDDKLTRQMEAFGEVKMKKKIVSLQHPMKSM